jgi:hypothetical protein
MAFRIDTDVKVQILAPNANEFTLNFSLLDGTDLLGVSGSLKSWADIQTEVISFDYEQGVSPAEGYFRPLASTATLRIRSTANNPDLNNRIYLGLPIRVQVRSTSGFNNFFVGFVNAMNTTYTPGTNNPEITLQLTNTLDSLLNTVLVVNYPQQTAAQRVDAITVSLQAFGLNQKIYTGAWASDTVLAVTGTYTVQELLEPILQRYRTYSELNYFDAVVIDGTTYYDVYLFLIQPKSDTIAPAPRTYKLTDQTPTTNETSYASLETSFDGELLINQVIIEDLTGTVVAQENNLDSQQLSGIQPLTATWQFLNNASLAPAWAQEVVAETDTKTYKNVQFDALDNFKDLKLVTEYLVTNYGCRFLDLIQTKYGMNQTVSSLITRQSHSITATGWLVTLELWKGRNFA